MPLLDLFPGYLSDAQLLRQRDALDALRQQRGSQAEARHWGPYPAALQCLAAWNRAECAFRQVAVLEPAEPVPAELAWPQLGPLEPQFHALAHEAAGRIPLPASTQALWAQHKYSVLARSPDAYHRLGVRLVGVRGRDQFEALAQELSGLLRQRPDPGGLRNALLHMWGYVAGGTPVAASLFDNPPLLLAETQRRVRQQGNTYLLAATALTELAIWL